MTQVPLLNAEADDTQTQCSVDSDCLPAQCCHPTSCSPKSEAPDCIDKLCTLNCAPGTMDCGQGSCACIQGKCSTILKSGETTKISK